MCSWIPVTALQGQSLQVDQKTKQPAAACPNGENFGHVNCDRFWHSLWGRVYIFDYWYSNIFLLLSHLSLHLENILSPCSWYRRADHTIILWSHVHGRCDVLLVAFFSRLNFGTVSHECPKISRRLVLFVAKRITMSAHVVCQGQKPTEQCKPSSVFHRNAAPAE